MTDEEKSIGKCECMYHSHKYLILRVFKEAIEKEKDRITRVDINRKEIIAEGMNPDTMITTSKKFIDELEKTRNVVKDTQSCK